MKLRIIGALVLLLTFSSSTTALAPSKPLEISNSDFVPILRDFKLNPTESLYQPPTRKPVALPSIIDLTLTDPKEYALAQIGSTQFLCLDKLFERESHWNPRAYNHSSGAYGIPQALPGSKMSIIANDWRTNPITQVKWGLRYIKQRYGTACNAWNHSQTYGWY